MSNLFVADEKKIRKRLLSVIGSALPACQNARNGMARS